jgi:hypothetical protein
VAWIVGEEWNVSHTSVGAAVGASVISINLIALYVEPLIAVLVSWLETMT